MGKAQKASLQALVDWIGGSMSRAVTIVQGQGVPGQRAAPTQAGSNDVKIGSRLDAGDLIEHNGKKFRRYKWQLNKNAENSTLKKLAAEDSHKVWSHADVEIKAKPSKEEARKAMQDLVRQLQDNMQE